VNVSSTRPDIAGVQKHKVRRYSARSKWFLKTYYGRRRAARHRDERRDLSFTISSVPRPFWIEIKFNKNPDVIAQIHC
jgi:hypothetical protein